MKYLLLSLALPYFTTAICLQFLNTMDIRRVWKNPGHVRYWNANTNEFDQLEALLSNLALCSVKTVNDLHGKTLVAGIYPMSPFVMLNANKTRVTGFIGDIWTTLEEVLGFKTIYRRVGRKYNNQLMNENLHALLIVSAMYRPSSCYYDYSLPFMTNSYALFVQSEGEKASRTWYFDTFSGDLWLTAFIFIPCIACSIVGAYHVRKLIRVNYTEFHDELSSPFFSFFYVLGGISGQGFPKIPRSWSLRLIILSCLLLGYLLSCGFSSTLTSDLTNRRFSLPFINLEDVAIKRTHTLCIRNDSSVYLHFTVNESVEGEIKDNWKGLVNHRCPDLSGDNANLIPELCDPSFAYLEVPNIFQSIYYKARRNCSIVQLPESYWSRKLAFLHSRTAQHRHLINMYILRMGTAGVLSYLERKWMSMDVYSRSSYFRQNTFQPVEYDHINLVFYGFFMMIVVSALICVLENVWYKQRLKYGRINPTSVLRGDTSLNMRDTRRKSRVIIARRGQTVRLMLSPELIKDPEFLRNVTVRANRW